MVGTERGAARLCGALAICLLAALLAAPGAQAGRALVGKIGEPTGSGKGQLSGPKGVAVNLAGAGGVGAGDVYVVDSNNNRVEEFTAAGAFVRAWGVDVVASGPDDKGAGAFEVCLAADVCKAGSESAIAGGLAKPTGIAIDQANGNVYVIDANHNLFVTNGRVNVYSATGAFEGAFGWHVNATSPEEKLQFCTVATGCQKGTVGGGAGQLGRSERSNPAVAPAKAPDAGNLFLADGGNARVQEVAPTLNGAEEVTAVTFVKVFGWDVSAPGSPDQSNEVQRVLVTASGGAFTLSFGADTTVPLEYNAPASESEEEEEGPESVEKALNALLSINTGGGSVTVTGGPRDPTGKAPYVVTFDGGPLAHADVPQLVPHKGSLSGTGANIEVETYASGTEGLEACVAARGDTCKKGSEGGHLGQFSVENPASVAVDSTGAVYAVDQSNNGCSPDPSILAPCRVYKFTFPGEGEVAVREFAPEQLTRSSGEANAQNPTDVAVDPENDHVLVAKKEGTEGYKFLEFDSAGTLVDESPAKTVLKAGNEIWYHGLAIGTKERFYFSNPLPLGVVDIFGPPPPPAVEIEEVTGIGTTTATFHGKVTPSVGAEGERFETFYHFEYSRNGISWTPFPTEDLAVGDGSGVVSPGPCAVENPPTCQVSRTIKTLEPNADYLVRLVATNGSAATSGSVAFTTKAAPPTVSGTVATAVTGTSAKLTGLVNPNNEPTTYHFEWGKTTAYGNEVPGFEAFAGSGGTPTKVSANISGLEEGTAYHFRVVATNETGTTEGADQEFTTLDAFQLPDGRAPEQVSPNDKRPVGSVGHILGDQMTFQAATDGNGIIYPLLNGLPDATAGGNVIYEAKRGAPGWGSSQITPPTLVPPIEAGADSTGPILYSSADLGCQLLRSFEPLSEDTPAEDVEAGVRNLYRRNADATYTLLTAPVPLNLPLAGGTYHVDWASSDCSHVLFDTNYQLLAGAPSSGRVLYEWEEGAVPPLRLVGVSPSGPGTLEEAQAGAGVERSDNQNSMSEDGSKVFFTARSDEGADEHHRAVFVRKGGAETVDVSQSQTLTPNDNVEGSEYQKASSGGSLVLFTGRYGLASNGTSVGAGSCFPPGTGLGNGAGCDLYAYDVGTEELTDLSADPNPADERGAGVIGLLDASDNGSYVYFAARGQLVPDEGRTEAQNRLGAGSYNIYLSHDGDLSYVGPVSQADTALNANSGTDLIASFSSWAADATPDGRHLLFVSKADVTGYKSGGAAEAYLYSAASGETVCVSCRTDGQKSLGNGDTEPITTKLQTETQNAAGAVQNRPRSISDDGSRVFFKMPDVLAPGAIEHTRNIYEWENGQVYLLLAGEEGGVKDFNEYADASASGNDVFVVSKEKLVPQDFDNTTDLYDLRAPHVPGEAVGFPPPPEPEPPCDPLLHECKPPATPQPAEEAAPPSAGPTAAGNPPVPQPKKPPHHKGKKGKRHHKRSHNHRRTAR